MCAYAHAVQGGTAAHQDEATHKIKKWAGLDLFLRDLAARCLRRVSSSSASAASPAASAAAEDDEEDEDAPAAAGAAAAGVGGALAGRVNPLLRSVAAPPPLPSAEAEAAANAASAP